MTLYAVRIYEGWRFTYGRIMVHMYDDGVYAVTDWTRGGTWDSPYSRFMGDTESRNRAMWERG